MNDTHFDAFAGHMQAALNALEVPAHLAAMIMAIVFASRDEIMGRAESGSSPVNAAAHAAAVPRRRSGARAGSRACAGADQGRRRRRHGRGARQERSSETKDSAVANQSIRVNVELLENLMTMVSELVLTRNQVLQILRKQKDSEFAGPLQRLNHVTSELQEGVMKTRMQPIGNAWSKLPRLVRDLSHELKKKIDLVMIGQDTELDRQVLEMIKDPLTHMVRNSADHGLEGPEERRRNGKPETGKVTLNAYHEGGHIIIEVSDDGNGLAIDKIKAKILLNGLASEVRAGADERAADPAVRLQGRLLHRRQGDQRLRPRRRHGRGQDQHREDRRHRRDALGGRQGHHLLHQDPADPRHRLGADRRVRAASASRSRRSAWSSWCAPPPTASSRSSGSRTRRCCACATACCRWSRCASCCSSTLAK